MLSKKYNPFEIEKKCQEYWQKNEVYKYDFESDKIISGNSEAVHNFVSRLIELEGFK